MARLICDGRRRGVQLGPESGIACLGLRSGPDCGGAAPGSGCDDGVGYSRRPTPDARLLPRRAGLGTLAVRAGIPSGRALPDRDRLFPSGRFPRGAVWHVAPVGGDPAWVGECRRSCIRDAPSPATRSVGTSNRAELGLAGWRRAPSSQACRASVSPGFASAPGVSLRLVTHSAFSTAGYLAVVAGGRAHGRA